MKLRSTLILNKAEPGAASPHRAFTLIEILVVIALFTMVVSLGLAFGFDSYRNYLFRSEYNSVLNIMSQARNRAVNNFYQSPYTFEILADEYRIYPSNDPGNFEDFTRGPSLQISPNTGSYEFEQLSGNNPGCNPSCILTFGNGLLTKTITINAAGGIISN